MGFRTLVWLGTVNTLLMFLFGAFAQQTLQLPTRQHNLTAQGSIERSLHYRARPVQDFGMLRHHNQTFIIRLFPRQVLAI